jgi:hypothetical protein
LNVGSRARHLHPVTSLLYPVFPHSISAQAPHPTPVAGVGVGAGSPQLPSPIPVAAPALPDGLGDRSSSVAQAFPLTAVVQAFLGGRASLPDDRARSPRKPRAFLGDSRASGRCSTGGTTYSSKGAEKWWICYEWNQPSGFGDESTRLVADGRLPRHQQGGAEAVEVLAFRLLVL